MADITATGTPSTTSRSRRVTSQGLAGQNLDLRFSIWMACSRSSAQAGRSRMRARAQRTAWARLAANPAAISNLTPARREDQ